MRTPSDEFLRDVAITAVEGGVNYWARIEGYRWRGKTGAELPWPVIELVELDDCGTPVSVHTLTKDAVKLAVLAILASQVSINETLFNTLLKAVEEDDAGMVDAELADCVVQVALFNEIVYG